MDIITGGIIGGIGSAIHKSKGQSIGKAFLIGFGKGCLGGSFTFAGKYYLYEMKNQRSYWIGWPCKILHSTGASIIENAAQNKPILSNWAFDYGPIRIDISGKNSKVRFLPMASAGILYHLIKGHKFNPKLTLQTGTLQFNSSKTINVTYINSAAVDRNRNWKKYSFFNNQYNTTGHEIIHTYQQREWLSINSFYLKNKSKYGYWDIPAFTIPYLIGGIEYYLNGKRYYSNPYELQADALSRRNSMSWDDDRTIPDMEDLPY